MDWLRLWHDMPNDPKWRTIARISGQPICLVQAMYLHLLVDASRNVTRGHVTVTKEDIASALDVTDEQIEVVLSAMQGRVLDGDQVTGWEKRQPKREDAGNAETGAKSAAQRKREQRERQKKEQEENGSHSPSRGVTESHDRLDKRRLEEDQKQTPPPARTDEFDSRIKFAMSEDWQPNEKSFSATLTLNGLANQVFEQDQFLEFKSFWIASPDDHRTQAKWEHALAQHLKRNLRNEQASGSTTDGQSNRATRVSQTGSGQGAQSGQRHARQGPLSAPDKVRAAIAERQARETESSESGYFVVEDD